MKPALAFNVNSPESESGHASMVKKGQNQNNVNRTSGQQEQAAYDVVMPVNSRTYNLATRMDSSKSSEGRPRYHPSDMHTASNSSKDAINGRKGNNTPNADEDASFLSKPKVAIPPMSSSVKPLLTGVSTSPKAQAAAAHHSVNAQGTGTGAATKSKTHKRGVSQTQSPETANDRSMRRRKLKPVPSSPTSKEPIKPFYGREQSASSSDRVDSLYEKPYRTIEDADSSNDDVHPVDGERPAKKKPKIPLEPKYFEQLVLTAQKELREYQEFIVQTILKKEHTKCRNAPGPKLKKQSASPFDPLKGQTTSKKACVLMVKDAPTGYANNKAASFKPLNVSISEIVTEVKSLPRYRSIGRLGQMPLARNVTIGKYVPYFPEDEALPDEVRISKYKEVRERYKAFEDYRSVFQVQRDCVERCAMWRPFVMDLMGELDIDPLTVVSFFKAGQGLEGHSMGIDDSTLALCLATQTRDCELCGLSSGSRWQFEELWERSKNACDIEYRSLPIVGLLAAAFVKVTDLLLWHVIYKDDSLRETLLRLGQEKGQRMKRWGGQVRNSEQIPSCLVCGLAYCPSHGQFLEDDDDDNDDDHDGDDDGDDEGDDDGDDDGDESGSESDKKVLLNDPEDSQNILVTVSQPRKKWDRKQKQEHGDGNERKHLCGVYCFEQADEYGTDLRGLQENGEISGKFRTEMEGTRSTLDPKETCSPGWECFWDLRHRRPDYRLSKLALCADQLATFEKCLDMCLGNERGPCIMRGYIRGVRCVDLFHMMLGEMRAVKHQSPPLPQPPNLTATSNHNNNNTTTGTTGATCTSTTNTNNSHQHHHHHHHHHHSHGARKWKGKRKGKEEMTKLEDRPVFVPCNHSGPCQDNNLCSCFRAKIECEWMCGCEVECERRFPGCSCHTGGQQVCLEGTCECWTRSRECDPWLCGSCGVVEVLDQANKYNEEIRKHRCMNNRIQLGLPARTIKAPSEVQGFGLFAGEDIGRNGFIGEYKGEVTSREECNRRGSAYHLSGMEYLFNLNQDQEVDASNFGNKTRFMNNSSNELNINVVGSTMLCNGVQRVMLCAKRDIKAGEELLFDYKYPEHVRDKFWERGKGDPSKNAITIVSNSQRSTSKSETSQAKKGGGKGKERASKHGTDDEDEGNSNSNDDYNSSTGDNGKETTSKRRRLLVESEASDDSDLDLQAKPGTTELHQSEGENEWQEGSDDREEEDDDDDEAESIAESVPVSDT